MSVRQQKMHKRQRTLEEQSELRKRRKLGPVLMNNDQTNVYLNVVLNELRHSLLDPTWEVRHGATLGLTEIMLHLNPSTVPLETIRPFVNDIMARCICILSLDRFCDYSLDLVVSPPQEIAGQLVAVLYTKWMQGTSDVDTSRRSAVLRHLDAMHTYATAWETRYGAAVALKYLSSSSSSSSSSSYSSSSSTSLIHSIQKETTVQHAMILHMLENDTDGDVRGVAAEAVGRSSSSLFSTWSNGCWLALWRDLKPKPSNDVSSSSPASSSFAIVRLCQNLQRQETSITTQMILDSMFLRLLLHGSSTVRNSALDVIEHSIHSITTNSILFLQTLLLLAEASMLEKNININNEGNNENNGSSNGNGNGNYETHTATDRASRCVQLFKLIVDQGVLLFQSKDQSKEMQIILINQILPILYQAVVVEIGRPIYVPTSRNMAETWRSIIEEENSSNNSKSTTTTTAPLKQRKKRKHNEMKEQPENDLISVGKERKEYKKKI